MNSISFTNRAWEEYCYWQLQDKKTLKRINLLLSDIQNNSFIGIGKPESLKKLRKIRLYISNNATYRMWKF